MERLSVERLAQLRVVGRSIGALQATLALGVLVVWSILSREAEYDSYRDGQPGELHAHAGIWLTLLFLLGLVTFSMTFLIFLEQPRRWVAVAACVQLCLGLLFVLPDTEIWILSVCTTCAAFASLWICRFFPD